METTGRVEGKIEDRRQAMPIETFYTSYGKAGFDYTLAFLLVVLLFPLFLALALLVYIDSPGKVLFRQVRVGKHGKEFWIYKFRTMHEHVPKQGVSPISSRDARVTRLGRILRASSLDELPQLFNILRGEMSFVGPRPEQKSIVDQEYTWLERQRLLVKPGLTGLWQISEDRRKPIHANLHHDLAYMQQISFRTDLKIICRTAGVMFRSNTC
ncbi:sugar transferase [Brevibacillus sp. TJ4]|uniref:sugar transferase n=1 Tax=Brevibacillus sp. TJ4 TaxID=3234853 RepID=UPI0037CD7357